MIRGPKAADQRITRSVVSRVMMLGVSTMAKESSTSPLVFEESERSLTSLAMTLLVELTQVRRFKNGVIPNTVRDLQIQAQCHFKEIPHYVRDDVPGVIEKLLQ
jgi:hypothetical protein